MVINDTIVKLKIYDGKFPRDALAQALKNREKITDELLKIIKYSTDNIKKIKEDESFIGHIFSMFLLAQFREKKAMLPVIQFFTALEGHDYDFCSEFIAEDLPRILASVYNGSFELLTNVIENNKINGWIRTAFLHSIVILYLHNDIKHEQIVEYFKKLFNKKEIYNDKYLFDLLVQSSIDLYFSELYDEIIKSFNNRQIKIVDFSFEKLKYMFSRNKDEVIKVTKSLISNKKIDNVILEMEDWACFAADF